MANVSDQDRYHLALQAGFTGQDAVTATAISIAENGSGDPAVASGKNDNGTFDLGLWQINSNWFPKFGGEAALKDPLTNAKAAYQVFTIQGFNAWCTFWPTGCGSANAHKPAVQAAWQSALQRANAVASGSAQEPAPGPAQEPVPSPPTGGAAGALPGAAGVSKLGFGDSVWHVLVSMGLVLLALVLIIAGVWLLTSSHETILQAPSPSGDGDAQYNAIKEAEIRGHAAGQSGARELVAEGA